MPFPTVTVTPGTGQIINTLPNAGQAVSDESLPVVIATDQSPIPAAQSGSWDVRNINGTISLPAGAATYVGQTSGNASLATLAGAVSGGVMAVNATSLPLPSGAATAANQSTEITALALIHADLNAALPAGANVIGKVGIDQTTQGTTNGVFVNGFAGALAANQSFAQPISQPNSISMAALNATVQWQVEPGVSHYVTLTNGPGATSQFSGTVTFQTSTDGTNWTNVNAVPIAGPTTAVGATATAVGLWLIVSPTGASSYIRTNMTSYSSGTVYALLSPFSTPSAVVAFPWNYTVTSGQTVVGPIDVSNFAEIYTQISAVTTTVLTAQGTNDPTLTTWDTVAVQEVKTQNAGALTITAAGTYKALVSGYKWFRLQCTTTGTVLTVQGVAGRMGSPTSMSAYGNSADVVVASGTVTTVSTVTSLSQIAASVPQMNIANGSTNKELGVSVATAITQTDVSAGAFAGAGRVNGTVIASAAGSGAVIAAEVNVTAITLGTATSVIAILQESTGGTNFTDIWTSDLITTTVIVRVPAIPVAGRRRWAFHSVGGTSTTVTVTITTLELPPGSFPILRQFRDAFSATNPFATVINNAAQTASSLVLTTLNSATTVFNVEGCKNLSAFMTVTGGTPTTAPVLTLQISMDGTSWFSTGTTISPTAAGAFIGSNNTLGAKYARLIVSTASAGGTGYTLGAVGINGVN